MVRRRERRGRREMRSRSCVTRAHTHTCTHTHTHTHTCEVEEEVLVKGDEGNVEGLPQIPVEPEAEDPKKKNAFSNLTDSSGTVRRATLDCIHR